MIQFSEAELEKSRGSVQNVPESALTGFPAVVRPKKRGLSARSYGLIALGALFLIFVASRRLRRTP